MVVKVAGVGRSFAGVAAYCLHDRREPGEPQPETSERVEWTDTRNLPTSRGDRAAAVMAAPELKRMAGGSAVGRKLEKHQALIVAHSDTAHRHVHVIVNRVDLETGKAAAVGRSRLRLSEWAKGYEEAQGQIRCERRGLNNQRRGKRSRTGSTQGVIWRRAEEHMQWERDAVPAREGADEPVEAGHQAHRRLLLARGIQAATHDRSGRRHVQPEAPG